CVCVCVCVCEGEREEAVCDEKLCVVTPVCLSLSVSLFSLSLSLCLSDLSPLSVIPAHAQSTAAVSSSSSSSSSIPTHFLLEDERKTETGAGMGVPCAPAGVQEGGQEDVQNTCPESVSDERMRASVSPSLALKKNSQMIESLEEKMLQHEEEQWKKVQEIEARTEREKEMKEKEQREKEKKEKEKEIGIEQKEKEKQKEKETNNKAHEEGGGVRESVVGKGGGEWKGVSVATQNGVSESERGSAFLPPPSPPPPHLATTSSSSSSTPSPPAANTPVNNLTTTTPLLLLFFLLLSLLFCFLFLFLHRSER
ncbi:MAG TPA: hypothetical protein V6C97_05815, partial [Oculatellaceae cyanobacterium]